MRPEKEIKFMVNTLSQSKLAVLSNNHKDKYSKMYKYLSLILPTILGTIFLAALIIPSIFLLLLMQETTSSQNQNQSIESMGYRAFCSGASPGSMWQMNTTYIITMIVNTTTCNFTDTPTYFLSIGNTISYNHWCLTGHNAIYFPTRHTFQIYSKSTCGQVLATTLLSDAVTLEWDINWIGFYK